MRISEITKRSLRNKKGSGWEFLGDNFARLVFSVIGILIIAYVVYRLIVGVTANPTLEQAQSSLDFLIGKINSNVSEVQISNPTGWYLSSFPAKTNLKNIYLMPRQCSNKGWSSCLCIYKGDINNPSIKGSVDSVDFTGKCQQSDYAVEGTVQNVPSALDFVNFVNKIFGITSIQIQNSIQISLPLPITLILNPAEKTISRGKASKTSLGQAQSSLDTISNSISKGSNLVQIGSPSGWFLESFPMNVKSAVGAVSEVPLPSQCSSAGWQNCLCICQYNFQSSPNCDSSNSVCVKSDFSVASSNTGTWSGVKEIFINNPPVNLEINYGDNTIIRK